MKKKNKNLSTNITQLFAKAQKLREEKKALAEKSANIDAKLADLELEWNDMRKDISLAVFGASSQDETSKSVAPQKKKPKAQPNKKRIKRRKAVKVLRKSNNLGTRDEIQAAARARDEKLIEVLKKSKKPMSTRELHKAVNNGSLEQIRTSLKRMRKLISLKGGGHSARYTMKG